jgi:hypothetical protein
VWLILAGYLAVGFDGGGVAASCRAGVAGRHVPRGGKEEEWAHGVSDRQDWDETWQDHRGQPPTVRGGGRADDGAAHQGGPRRLPRPPMQAQGELEVRSFHMLLFLFFLFWFLSSTSSGLRGFPCCFPDSKKTTPV